MKNIFIAICLTTAFMAVAGNAFGQELSSAYFTNDFKYRHDMNPAFANEQSYFSIPVIGGMGMQIQGNFGLKDILFKNPQTGTYNLTFMHPDVSVSDALSGFKDRNRILTDISIDILSMGFEAFDGYNTIELRERTSAGLQLPYELFVFAKDLRNKDYEFNDISVSAQSYAELALGHSRQINDQLRVGAKLKLLFGVGRANLEIEKMNATFVGDEWRLSSTGDTKAEVNMKGIEFKNVKNEMYQNGEMKTYVDLGETDIKNPIFSGFGLGVDLGAQYKLMDNLSLSAALTDLGFISWSNNYLLKQKSGTFTFKGFHDIKVKDNGGISFDDQMDEYEDQISDFVNLQNHGDQGSTTSTLYATASLGAEYSLPSYDKLSFGLLGRHRFAGDFSWTEGRLSANWAPLKWLDGGMSIGASNFGVSTGWVLNIHPRGYNFFVGMDHIFGKMSKEFIPLSSNAQFSVGMSVTWAKKEKLDVKKKKEANNNNEEQLERMTW